MSLQTRALSYGLGAEIIGLDLRKPVDDKTFSEIHAAFLKYSVLLLKGQSLTREQHIAFSRRFGELDNNDGSVRLRLPDYPEILLNKPKPNGDPELYAGMVWHTDRGYSCTPPMASLLRSIEIPEVGGDTMFANMYLAYETLSDGMKKLIEGLHGVHFGGKRRIVNSTSPEETEHLKRITPPVAQPLVRIHPETGRKSLFVGEKVKQLVGMTPEESEPLIHFLYKHAARPQFVYRHQWRKDDLLIWDQRCTLHIALGDYDKSQIRHMEKTTVLGTPSGYVYDGPLYYEGPRL